MPPKKTKWTDAEKAAAAERSRLQIEGEIQRDRELARRRAEEEARREECARRAQEVERERERLKAQARAKKAEQERLEKLRETEIATKQRQDRNALISILKTTNDDGVMILSRFNPNISPASIASNLGRLEQIVRDAGFSDMSPSEALAGGFRKLALVIHPDKAKEGMDTKQMEEKFKFVSGLRRGVDTVEGRAAPIRWWFEDAQPIMHKASLYAKVADVVINLLRRDIKSALQNVGVIYYMYSDRFQDGIRAHAFVKVGSVMLGQFTMQWWNDNINLKDFLLLSMFMLAPKAIAYTHTGWSPYLGLAYTAGVTALTVGGTAYNAYSLVRERGQEFKEGIQGFLGALVEGASEEAKVDGLVSFLLKRLLKRSLGFISLKFVTHLVLQHSGFVDKRYAGAISAAISVLTVNFLCTQSYIHVKKSDNGIEQISLEDESDSLLLRRAKQGDAEAQYDLSALYDNQGKAEEAKKWLYEAAANGYVEAQVTLGALYDKEGDGEKAERWWLSAAEQGDVDAQLALGFIYENEGYIESAKRVWLHAAEAGSAQAQSSLCIRYSLDEDLANAWMWGKRAAEQGVTDCIDILMNSFKELEQSLLDSFKKYGDKESKEGLCKLYKAIRDEKLIQEFCKSPLADQMRLDGYREVDSDVKNVKLFAKDDLDTVEQNKMFSDTLDKLRLIGDMVQADAETEEDDL